MPVESDNSIVWQLHSLIEWVQIREEDVKMLHPIGGDLTSVQQQQSLCQRLRMEMEEKRPQVEAELFSGRKFLQEEGPDDRTLSTDSDESNGTIRRVRHHIRLLTRSWAELNQIVVEKSSCLENVIHFMLRFEESMADVEMCLTEAERHLVAMPVVTDLMIDDLQAEADLCIVAKRNYMPVEAKIEAINCMVDNLSGQDIVLSHVNVTRLENLTRRLKGLHTNLEDRSVQLQKAMTDFGPDSQVMLASSVDHPWERAVTINKVPYFINHTNECTQWDHPAMSELLVRLAELNDVRFSAYRTALKLRVLQRTTCLDMSSLNRVSAVLDQQEFCVGGFNNDKLIDIAELINSLTLLYDMLAVESPTKVNVPYHVDLLLNWLLNMFDKPRNGKIRLLSYQVVMVLLCKAPLEDKYRYLFRLIADENGLVDQSRVGLLLHDCLQLPRQLGEVASFGGSNIEPSVLSCFSQAHGMKHLDKEHFLDWLRLEPQSLVWLPVMHRLAAAENSKHQVRCNICKEMPIHGLRYRCLRCFNFDMCQKCFFSGRQVKGHKLSHPMQEYCTATTSGQNVRDFTRVVRNKLLSRRQLKKQPRLGYLPVQTVLEGQRLPDAHISQCVHNTDTLRSNCSSQQVHSRLEAYASRLAEIEHCKERSVDTDEEHNLIAHYCSSLYAGEAQPHLRSPMELVMAIDGQQRDELETMIHNLEAENSNLQCEYDELRQAHQNQVACSALSADSLLEANENAEMLAEARLLRQHKGRLEARMNILEDHNLQLEQQLARLRQLLETPEAQLPESAVSSPKHGPLVLPPTSAYRPPPPIESTRGHFFPSEIRGTSFEDELNGVMQEIHSSFPTGNASLKSPPAKTPMQENSVGNLLHMAGQVSRAVGSLVNVMTDDEVTDNDEDGDCRKDVIDIEDEETDLR